MTTRMETRPLAKFARGQTRLRLKEVGAVVRRAAKHPKDPEVAHDLRVAIRRFSQCVELFEGLFTLRSVEKIHKPLHKLMTVSGNKRDYDVGIQVLEESGVKPQSSVMQNVREKRDRELKTFARYLRRKKIGGRKKIRREAAQWRKRLRTEHQPVGAWNWSQGVLENVQRMLPPRAERYFEEGDAALAARSDHKALHHFRLETKRLRYALEVFRSVIGREVKPKLAALGKLQDRLGAINDCVVVLALPEMDRAAARAVNRLLVRREAALRSFWEETFPPRSRLQWTHAMRGPRRMQRAA